MNAPANVVGYRLHDRLRSWEVAGVGVAAKYMWRECDHSSTFVVPTTHMVAVASLHSLKVASASAHRRWESTLVLNFAILRSCKHAKTRRFEILDAIKQSESAKSIMRDSVCDVVSHS